MRVLVTGASGGLGRFLVDRLLADRRVERLTLMARRTEALPTGDKIRTRVGRSSRSDGALEGA